MAKKPLPPELQGKSIADIPAEFFTNPSSKAIQEMIYTATEETAKGLIDAFSNKAIAAANDCNIDQSLQDFMVASQLYAEARVNKRIQSHAHDLIAQLMGSTRTKISEIFSQKCSCKDSVPGPLPIPEPEKVPPIKETPKKTKKSTKTKQIT